MLSETRTCREIVDTVLDEGDVVSLALRAHVDRCPNCRADLRSQRALIEALRAVRAAPPAPPADLLASIQAEVARVAERPANRLTRAVRVAPYVGGVVAATAAGALLAGRRRTRFAL